MSHEGTELLVFELHDGHGPGDGGDWMASCATADPSPRNEEAGSSGEPSAGLAQCSTMSSLVYSTARRLSLTGERPSDISLSFSISARGARLLT